MLQPPAPAPAIATNTTAASATQPGRDDVATLVVRELTRVTTVLNMSDTRPIEHPNWLTSDFADAAEPFRLFGDWFADAVKSEPSNPNAMALATVDAAGLPDVRMVLLKGFDEAGFVFYSNRNSAKGQEIAANP